MIVLWTLLVLAQEDPAKAGPFQVVVETRHYRDEARNRPLRTEIWRPETPMRSPVVLFSHGFAGTRLQSKFLCSHLASHGYVVASPDHKGNTFLDLNIFKSTESAKERPHDLRVVLDRLIEESENPESTLFGRLDGTRCAAIGHSFGGYTAPGGRRSVARPSRQEGERRRPAERSRLLTTSTILASSPPSPSRR